tara:strand:+ start:240 stop:422 length:183 start_codon:yes stop_codon:yes gene_type:complete
MKVLNIQLNNNQMRVILYRIFFCSRIKKIENKHKNKHGNIQKEYLKAVKGYFKSLIFRIL